MYGYIYRTTNKANGIIYIGQKKGLFNPKYLGSGILIKRAIKKWGKKSFIVEPIAVAMDKESLDNVEIFLISKYRKLHGKENLYNISEGGYFSKGLIPWNKDSHFPPNHTGMLGKKHRKETKEKIRKANLGKSYSPKTQFKKGHIGYKSAKGKCILPRIKKKISKALKGRKRPDLSGENHWTYKRRILCSQ